MTTRHTRMIKMVLIIGLLAGLNAFGGDQSLVGYWKLDEGQGRVAADSSGNGRTGKINGNPQWVKETGPGLIRGALEFNGTDNYVDCGNADSLNLHGKNFTLMAWIYIEGHGGAILSKELGGKNWPEYGIFVLGDLTVQSYFWNVGSPLGGSTVNSPPRHLQRWYHIAATYDGSTQILYIDGVEKNRNKDLLGSPYAGSNKLFIGASPDTSAAGFGGPFKGRIAEVAVFSRCLSEEEVNVCFQEGISSLKAKDVTGASPKPDAVQATEKETAVRQRAIDLSSKKKLFVDDYEIEKMQGLKRKLHQPVKYAGNPVLKGENRWEDVSVQSRTPPQWVPEEKVWKIWYLCSESRWEGEPETAHMCYAVSSDGIRWEKPVLGVFNYHGSTKNNIIGNSFIENIVYDPNATEGWGRYKGLSGAIGRFPIVSKDGISWKATGAPKMESGDESFMTYDETSGQYLATVKVSGPYGRSVALSTSKDFWNWTKPELIFHTDERDQAIGRQRNEAALADPRRLVPAPQSVVPEKFRTDVYNMAVFPYEGLYLGLPCIFDQTGPTPDDNQDGLMYVELAVSRDLKVWHRVADRGVFIGLGPKGSYDSGMTISAGRPILRDNELWFYYNAFSVTHSPTVPTPGQAVICLAKLRLDGFVSLEAGKDEGSLLTKPIVVAGKHLFINADAPQGKISAEIVDESGKAIPGFSAGECIPFKGDDIKGEIKWKDGSGLSKLAGQKVRLRFLLQNASFYAFWIGK